MGHGGLIRSLYWVSVVVFAFPLVDLEGGSPLLLSVVFKHLVLVTFVLLDFDHQLALRLWRFGFNYIVVVAVGAVLVGLLELGHIFAERLLALFAQEHHLHGRHQVVVLAVKLVVALGAVEPLFAAWRSNRHLGIHNVFAHLKF